MPPSIPPVIAPYLSDPPPDSLLLIASVLDAPANWLVVRSISAALQERQDQNAHPINHETTTRSSARRVVFLSLLRPLSLWNEIGKKAGLDIPGFITKRQILYIDGLEIYGKAARPEDSAGITALRSHGLEEVKNVLQRAVNASSETPESTATAHSPKEIQDKNEGPVLIIDGLDFLIASQPELTATSCSQMLTSIRQHVHSTILTVSSDVPLLHNNSATTTPLEMEHQAFVASMAHQSQLVMQLRGLDTGSAKDVSGVIRISHGSEYQDDIVLKDLPEGEWLYKVSGDGSVRVWGRGE